MDLFHKILLPASANWILSEVAPTVCGVLAYSQFRWPVSMACFWPLNEWLWLRGQLRAPSPSSPRSVVYISVVMSVSE